MPIRVRPCNLAEISPLRELYLQEMNCQVTHYSIPTRPGWTREYALDLDTATVAYASVAVAGPWATSHALYEFYVQPDSRHHIFDLFAALLPACSAKAIETQTNAPILPIMLHTFCHNIRAEAILFEDRFQTHLCPEGATFRRTKPDDAALLKALDLDESADWLVTSQNKIAGAGGILYHYNRPYGDIYMSIAEPFRNQGLGAYLVQELKAACHADGSVPAARCNPGNLASRKTLQKAGFVPCGNRIVGDLQKR